MSLVKLEKSGVGSWSPFERLSTLQEEINRLFESPLATLTRGRNT